MEQLRNENAVLRSGGLAGATSGLSGFNRAAMQDGIDARLLPPPSPAEESASAIALAPIQPRDPRARGQHHRPAAPPGSAPSPPPRQRHGGRRHAVAPKDSLYGIAKKYYGTATNAEVQALIDANRDVLPAGAGTPLEEGMALKIPSARCLSRSADSLMPRTSRRTAVFTESLIREMSRVAARHGAIDLSQGFPDWDPPAALMQAGEDADGRRRAPIRGRDMGRSPNCAPRWEPKSPGLWACRSTGPRTGRHLGQPRQ